MARLQPTRLTITQAVLSAAIAGVSIFAESRRLQALSKAQCRGDKDRRRDEFVFRCARSCPYAVAADDRHRGRSIRYRSGAL